ncbi:hypothetical protein R6Q59_014263 [Mikania micrantha]|uniref:DNA-directed RNA polymerase III subunit RPC4 n=1 Tax=Mikania micrantha TaxID=192012 RepID=A0A5N6P8D4_9ASTR|nr:hypothetical protein E3N88_12791 [Mikania micrantha]
MDVDPPVPPSSTPKKVSKSTRKPKFTPKPPVKRNPAPVLTKSDGSDADSESEQELLSEVIGRLRPRVSKVEKKSSNNATASQGGGPSRDLDIPKKEKDANSKNSLILKETFAKSDMLSSSIATKIEYTDQMLVDDQFGSSSNSENEYKEPWDPYSYHPISLPLRPPMSGNPEVLNSEEFGKEDEYNETKINSALDLGLLESGDDDKKHILFFQFPEQLPLDRAPVSLKGKEKARSSSSLTEDASNKWLGLKDLPNGHMGKLLVYKSGAIKLKLGDNLFNVSSGTCSGSDRSVAMMNTKSKDCCVLGKVDKRAIVTPDLNSILDNIN